MGQVRAEKIKFSDLEFLEDNPRTIKEPNLKRLAQRIKDDPTFFDNRSCLVNFTGGKYLCYAGFQRAHAAAKILKWKEIPCMVENDVPIDLMRKRAIYDNTHDGEWNSEVLSSWEFEVEEYREMGVPEWVFGADGHPVNEMSEDDLNMLEEFDPVGLMAGQPKYPVYIVSKGRAYNPMTAKIFEGAGIDYLIAVEPQEADEYIAALSEKRVLILPFSNLGLGSFPARNYCWEHSIRAGHAKHWVFDDNIEVFNKWQGGGRRKSPSVKDAICYVETFSDSNNIDISGFEKNTFSTRVPKKPFKINCHVYSTLLIKNSLPYRWRLKYNEDIDLCLQVLHNGGSTASCVYYLAEKVSTSDKMKGGNQTELYQGNDPKKKLLKAKMLQAVWPQYVKVVIRFGRYHHLINWKVFSQKKQSKKVEIGIKSE